MPLRPASIVLLSTIAGWFIVVAEVQSGPASSSSSVALSSPASGSEGAVAGETSRAVELAQEWFISNSKENQTYLAMGVNSALSDITGGEVICGAGVPSLQRRTPNELPNKGCPAIFTTVNGSCTCLPDYSDQEEWEFRVTTRSSESIYPVLLNDADVLPIDTIRTLLVPSTVTSLAFVGVGDEPQTFSYVAQDTRLPGSNLPIVLNDEDTGTDTSITTVRFENIDLSSIVLTAGYFIPANILNLTLRNCALERFGYDFFQGLGSVRYLDLSQNQFIVPYAGNAIGKTCSTQFCQVEVLNLTSNLLTDFPTVVFNLDYLRELYIGNNSITDFSVSETIYEAISSLDVFESDLPDASASCTDGAWRAAHSSRFCVLSAVGFSNADKSSSSSNIVLYVAIGAGVLVVILLMAFLYTKIFQKPKRYGHWSFSSSSPKSYSTRASYDEGHERQVNQQFLNDPIIVTNRIDYKHLRFGKCISKGGFGLVFVGEYHSRRVAIKKVRPDRCNDATQIEDFLKEITLMAVLYHPRIVEFIGVSWENLRHLSAVTEFMDNGDLRDVLRGFKEEGTPLSWDTHKSNIALHIAEALSYLHSYKPKVIHRDLKSKNVLINMYLEAKLSDFGISRIRTRLDTHMTAGAGTSFWIAPEVLLGRDYDERADIYSFGVVLSEIDTDDYPFWNDANPATARGKLQEAEILSQVAAGELRPSFSQECPEEILDLAESCLQANPLDRPSADEVVGFLQDLLHPSRRSASESKSDDSSSMWSVRRE